MKPRAVPPIFCLNVQTDHYNGHPRHFADELPDYLREHKGGVLHNACDESAIQHFPLAYG